MSDDIFESIDDTINDTFDTPVETKTVDQEAEKEETTDLEQTETGEQDETLKDDEEKEDDQENEELEEPDPEQLKKERKKRRAQKRIDNLTKEKYNLRARLEKYEEKYGTDLDNLNDQMPDRDDYKSDDEFLEAYTDWKSDKKRLAEKKDEAATKKHNEDVKILSKKVEDAKKQYSDWQEKMDNISSPNDFTIPEKNKEFFNEIFVHDQHGTDLLYYFGTNPDVYKDTIDLPPRKAEMFVGRLIEKIATKKRQVKAGKATTKAPKPATKLKGASRTSKNMENASMDDYAKWFHKRRKKRNF